MSEATSITCRQLTNVGEEMVFELASTATDGETITIPTSGPGAVVKASLGTVKLISAQNVTAGTAATTCVYTTASRLFTFVESGVTDCDLRIQFSYQPA